MRQTKNIIFIILFFINFNCISMSKVNVKMAYFDNFYPFSFSDENITKGIFVDYLEYVFHNSNKYNVTSYSFPWERAQDFVRKNQYDGHITLVNEKRNLFLYHNKNPIFTDRLLLVYSKNNKNKNLIKQIKSKNDLKKFTINDYIGNSLSDLYYPKKDGFDIDFSASIEACFKKLLNGRGDVILADRSIIDMLVSQKKRADIGFIDASFIVQKYEYFLHIRKNLPYAKDFIDEFDRLSNTNESKNKFDELYKYYINNVSKFKKYESNINK
ncbi:substrate-binding periplasmic protein [Fluviispira vulneris]|uniref:substrate-binding periplasmic protein n=1 Tax=Fluviispira vulneris TaxID=2763012 RepID=UPI001647D3BC|nr:transporter substrate-binding domain-containing protein [Fluviispira vulneris]